MNKFSGFEEPKSNYSKLPNITIDALPIFSSLGEMKVVLYILRHTWGFGDEEKRISIDEFEHGRKKRDGTRIDNGTGMTAPSIRLGIKKAIEHGFIIQDTDDHDKARIKKYYSLNIRGKESLPQIERTFTPGVKNLYPVHRKKPKKETKEIYPSALADDSENSLSIPETETIEPWKDELFEEVDLFAKPVIQGKGENKPTDEQPPAIEQPIEPTPVSRPKKKRAKSAYELRSELFERTFAEARGCPLPKWDTVKAAKGSTETWRKPLNDIYEYCGKDEKITIQAIRMAVSRLMEIHFTCAIPIHIRATAMSIALDLKNGTYEEPKPKPNNFNRSDADVMRAQLESEGVY